MTYFCKYSWKAPAIALLTLVMCTFVGGFYVLEHSYKHIPEYEETPFPDLFNTHLTNLQPLQIKMTSTVVAVLSKGNETQFASGVLIHPEGYIVSVWHAVNGASSIQVKLTANKRIKKYKAEVVKRLPEHDLVLLKLITKDTFPYLNITNTQNIDITQTVFASGFTEQGHLMIKEGHLLQKGITLTVDKNKLTHLLQTDAIYNWQQSGGPLVNAEANLLGINILIKDASGQLKGFAIPTHVIMAHLQDVVTLTQITPPTPTIKPTLVNYWSGTLSSKSPIQPVPPISLDLEPLANLNNQGNVEVKPPTLAAAWWQKARTQVTQENSLGKHIHAPSLAMNTTFIEPENPPAQPIKLLDIGNKNPLKIGGYKLNEIFTLMLLGVIAGVMGCITPLGGGIFQIAGMLIILEYEMYLIRPVMFISCVFVYSVIALRFHIQKSIDKYSIIEQIPWVISGMFAGFFLGSFAHAPCMTYLLAIVALLLAFSVIYGEEINNRIMSHAPSNTQAESSNDALSLLLSPRRGAKTKQNNGVITALSATPIGFFGGLFGLYNGAIEMQRYFGRFPADKALANSSVLILFAAITGALLSLLHGTHNELFAWETPVFLALILVPNIFSGALLGAHIKLNFEIRLLQQIYAILLMLIVITLVYTA